VKTGARMQAAIEVLGDILERHRPASVALADWGRAHRFAGSGDRAAIGNLVFDVLRRRRSLAAQMGADTPRALVIAAAPVAFSLDAEAVKLAADDPSPHVLEALTEEEWAGLNRGLDPALPVPIRGDFPDAFEASLARVFGADLESEMAAFAVRAPVGLRANPLKADREKVMKALERFHPEPGSFAPGAVIIPHPAGGRRTPNVEADPAHGKGWFEVQDEGSQIAALLSEAGPRDQVLDLCAGAGGKTLALGGQLRNTGQIYAYDRDPRQLRPIFERIKRAGVRNVQIVTPGDEAALRELGARFDVVLVDAPCSGSGTWRRRPDAKWRLSEANVAQRIEDQRAVLQLGRELVKPGGRLVYVTCSILPEENVDQVAWFLGQAPDFHVRPWRQAWAAQIGENAPASADRREDSLLLTPRSHGTDGFFVAVFERSSGSISDGDTAG
jgi:16S rRNA (cytosine967-C5)-methyltransferase